MAYIPPMAGYKPFYIQTPDDESAIDTTVYGMVAKTNPYAVLPEPKEPFKNEWKDENGDDEYLESIFYKPIEFSVSFYVKAYNNGTQSAISVLLGQIDDFFLKVHNGHFRTYDSYTGIGYDNVRYAGYNEDSFVARDNWARLIFTVKFKANDPISRVKYINGTLTKETENGEV